jgi:anti-anti-sigma factor
MAASGSMHTRVEAMAWGAVVRVMVEKITERDAGIIEAEAADAGPMNRWRIAVDCSQVTFLPSVGIGMLVRLHQRCKQGGGKMTIFGLSDQLTKLVKLTGVDKLIPLAADQAGAAKALGA